MGLAFRPYPKVGINWYSSPTRAKQALGNKNQSKATIEIYNVGKLLGTERLNCIDIFIGSIR